MFFLAHWQVVARGNHSFAQTVLRHDERWACMLFNGQKSVLLLSIVYSYTFVLNVSIADIMESGFVLIP